MKCVKCGFDNPVNAKFCNQCGVALIESPKDKGHGLRRRVAVVFADISGFTPLSENLDPEEVKDLIDNCLQNLAQIIYKYDGYIDKFIGDCIMALFGAPIVHEDDPLRSVMASLELMHEIEKFNKEKKLHLGLSIGINYGLVATGDLGRPGEYTVMGDVVNLAQRLQNAAPRGKIYVSEATFEQTNNEVVYGKLGSIRVKGKKEKVLVFTPRKIMRPYSIRKMAEMPLIGRSCELKKLINFHNEVKTGHGRIVSVVGEAGIGKSKLVYELKRKLTSSTYLFEGRGVEYFKTSPYLVLKEMLKSVFQIKEDETKEVATKKTESFIGKLDDPTIDKALPFIKYFLSLALAPKDISRFESMRPKDRIRLINEAMLSLLLKISQQKPVVIIFEDCHWIDDLTIDFMRRLAAEIAREAIMLINIYRPTFRIGRVARLKHFAEVNLETLSGDDIIDLSCSLLHCSHIEDKLLKLLLHKSAGVPFYIHELIRNLLNNNFILVENNIAKLKSGMESVIPRTLDEIVMARIDKLDSELRLIINVASVIGDEFSAQLLDELLPQVEKLRTDLVMLIQRDIIQRSADPVGGPTDEGYYRFKHSITRDAVYNSLLKKDRGDYHRRIGYAIERVCSVSLNEYYDVLAQHFLQGGEKDKVIEYLEKAADRKKELYLNQDAIDLYHQCIEMINKAEWAKIAKIYEKMGYIYILIGDYTKAVNVFNEMQDLGQGDALLTAKALGGMARVAIRQALFDRAVHLLDRSRKILRNAKKLSDPTVKIELANILSRECWIYRIKGKITEAENKGKEAVRIIKGFREWTEYENLKRALAEAYTNLAVVYSIRGEYEKAIDLCEDTLIIAEESGDRHGIGSVYNLLGTVYKEQGKYDEAIDSYTRKLKISEELGDKNGVGAGYCNIGLVYQVRREFEKAVALFEKYLNISQELGDKQAVVQALVNLGIAYWHKGKYERAIALFENCLKISKKLGDKRTVAIALGNIGEVYASQLEYKKAIDLFKKCLKMSNELSDRRCLGYASYNLGTVYTEIGRLSEAERFLKLAKESFGGIGSKFDISDTHNSLANLKLKQKKFDDAFAAAKTAFELSKEIDSTEARIRALANMGKIYDAQSRLSTARKGQILHRKSGLAFGNALVLSEKLNNKRILADNYYEYAHTLLDGSKHESTLAQKYLNKALKIYKELSIEHRIREIISSLKLLKSR